MVDRWAWLRFPGQSGSLWLGSGCPVLKRAMQRRDGSVRAHLGSPGTLKCHSLWLIILSPNLPSRPSGHKSLHPHRRARPHSWDRRQGLEQRSWCPGRRAGGQRGPREATDRRGSCGHCQGSQPTRQQGISGSNSQVGLGRLLQAQPDLGLGCLLQAQPDLGLGGLLQAQPDLGLGGLLQAQPDLGLGGLLQAQSDPAAQRASSGACASALGGDLRR